MKSRVISLGLFLLAVIALGTVSGCSDSGNVQSSTVPADIRAVLNKPMYTGATWGLRVVNADSGEVLINLQPDHLFYIGSVRKTFSVGELLNQVGPDHHYDTPVYRQGSADNTGVLHGNLIIQASGDLTMGGRTNPDGSIAISDYDHNEANTLGNAVLTKPDPLAGYKALAAQVMASGIKEITGDVIIDDRLFQPFEYRGEFDIRPIFVNDDLVDLIINPTTEGQLASVEQRPVSAALNVDNTLITSGAGTEYTLKRNPEYPACIGAPGCTVGITGELPTDFVPRFTDKFPLVQTFRITQPSNYARTVFIEALEAAGVTVDAPTVAVNPVDLLPLKNSYPDDTKVAELIGMPYSDYAKLILKVSYNLGADTSLLLYGVTQGVDNMTDTLRVEQTNLANHYGIQPNEYNFVNGSGGADTKAVNRAVTQWLAAMRDKSNFQVFYNALPNLGKDGSLAFVTDFQSDPSLAGATAEVHAKTGTNVMVSVSGQQLVKGQAFGGYIHTKSGKDLVYQLVVNDVPRNSLDDLIQIFQDEGTISAILWRDY